jgi:phage replication O-like protein O
VANPQPDIFVKVSKELFRAIYKTRISGVERQVLDLILYETYGYLPNRKTVPLTNREIARRVGITRQNTNRAINALLKREMIIVVKNDYEKTKRFGIQKDYDKWVCSQKRVTDSKLTTVVVKNESPHQYIEEDITPMSVQTKKVFEYWRKVMGKNGRVLLTKDRKTKIQARLKEGYTVEDLKLAVDGCKLTPHNMGKNDRNTPFNDIELICRKGSNVERFRDHAKRTKQKPRYAT